MAVLGCMGRFCRSRVCLATNCLSPNNANILTAKVGISGPAVKRMRTASSKLEGKQRNFEDPPDFEVVVPKDVQQRGSFLKTATVKESIPVRDDLETGQFEDMGLNPQLLMRLKETGFDKPTPIQAVAIPEILKGENCALQSYTGSGKTLAYMLPLLTLAIERAREEWEDESINLNEKGQLQVILNASIKEQGFFQGLIVAPSQELAMQIVHVAEMALPNDAKLAVQQLIGGANILRQIERLKMKPLIGVGTPGRLAELSRKGHLLSHKCPILVLDEVDQLSKVQFRRDMLRIVEHTGKKLNKRQTIAVSATLTPQIIERNGTWAPDAQFVFIGSHTAIQEPLEELSKPNTTIVPHWGWGNKWTSIETASRQEEVSHGSISMPPNIRHGYVLTEESRKIDALRRAIHAMDSQKCLIFMNFAKRTQDALFKLSARGMPVGALHGDKSKMDRSSILQQFRNGKLRALVVSDVLARGLDVADCDAVFNAELPTNASHYAHRAGRTGRMGRTGWVLSFVEKREVFVLEKLARKLKIEIPRVEIRNGEISLTMLAVKVPRAETLLPVAFPVVKAFVRPTSFVRVRETKLRKAIYTRVVAEEISLPEPLQDVLSSSVPQDEQTIAIAAIGGLVFALLLGFGLVYNLGSTGTSGISPSNLESLLKDKNTLIVDIRSRNEVQEMGSPVWKGAAARRRSFPYTKRTKDGGEQILPNFGEAFAKQKGTNAETKIVLFDGFGQNAASAAKEINKATGLSVSYVSGGASALQASGIEWKTASEGVSLSFPKFDLSGLDLDKVAETYKERPTLFNTGLAASAFAAAGIFLFNEFDIILEAVGLLGGVNIYLRKFFFAEDREKTLRELRSLFDDKIVPKEAGDDLKKLATAILETPKSPSETTTTFSSTPSPEPAANPMSQI